MNSIFFSNLITDHVWEAVFIIKANKANPFDSFKFMPATHFHKRVVSISSVIMKGLFQEI